METVRVINVRNPNIIKDIRVPIGVQIEQGQLDTWIEIFRSVVESTRQGQVATENVMKNFNLGLANLEYASSKIGFIYHNLADLLKLDKKKYADLPQVEEYLFETYADKLNTVNMPRIFTTQADNDNNNNNDVVDFAYVKKAFVRGLGPLEAFLALFVTDAGLSGNEQGLYRVKPENLIIYKNISSIDEFVDENYFLGDALLQAIRDNKKLTREFIWENLTDETLRRVLSLRIYGAINSAWKELGSKYEDKGGVKLYMISQGVDKQFSKLAGALLKTTQSGNAYPGFVRGGQTTYRLSSGIQTQAILRAQVGNLITWINNHAVWSESKNRLMLSGK